MKKTLPFLLLYILPSILSAQHLLYEFSKCRLANHIYLDQNANKCNCKDTITVGYYRYVTTFQEGRISMQTGTYLSNGAVYEELFFDSTGKIKDTVTKKHYDSGELLGTIHWIYCNQRNYTDRIISYKRTGEISSSEKYDSLGRKNGVCEYWFVNDTFHSVEQYEMGRLRMKLLFNKNEELLWVSFLDNSIDGVSSIEFLQHDLMKITYYNGNDVIYSEKRKLKLRKKNNRSRG